LDGIERDKYRAGVQNLFCVKKCKGEQNAGFVKLRAREGGNVEPEALEGVKRMKGEYTSFNCDLSLSSDPPQTLSFLLSNGPELEGQVLASGGCLEGPI